MSPNKCSRKSLWKKIRRMFICKPEGIANFLTWPFVVQRTSWPHGKLRGTGRETVQKVQLFLEGAAGLPKKLVSSCATECFCPLKTHRGKEKEERRTDGEESGQANGRARERARRSGDEKEKKNGKREETTERGVISSIAGNNGVTKSNKWRSELSEMNRFFFSVLPPHLFSALCANCLCVYIQGHSHSSASITNVYDHFGLWSP